MTRKIRLLSLGLVVTFIYALVGMIGADGGKAKNVVYQGQVRAESGDGSTQFSVDPSPIIFYLGTVNNKYHVLLIRVRNETSTPLRLAKDQDSIEMRFADGQTVRGVLNLPAADRATWDGLETELRTAVAYPEVVPAREEEGIYIYLRVGDVAAARKKHEMPSSVIYNVKSLQRPVELRPRGVSKK